MDPQEQLQLQLMLVEVFLEEAKPQLQELNHILAQNSHDWPTARRIAHTLKGSSRAVGLSGAEGLATGLEKVFRQLEDGEIEYKDCQAAVDKMIRGIAYWVDGDRARIFLTKQSQDGQDD